MASDHQPDPGNGGNGGNGNGTTPRSMRFAGLLITVGMLVEAGTLFWARPISFLVFAGGGALLVLVGIAVYFWSLLRFAQTAETGQHL